ncbi:MAG: hypothetical protein GDA46_03220 [Bdellovibrionales bacterium]|nr:hypothetical protein [Bdellovibrionales bacterium]
MESFFNYIELVGGALSSILAILVFFNIVVFPFFFRLNLQLTKDFFFRLTKLGEWFFPRVIVYAPTNIQIIDCIFELKGKKSTQATSYICKAEKFGSVERNAINDLSVASFYLPKSSPDFFLKKEESKELLIQCSINESTEKIKKSLENLYKDYYISMYESKKQDKFFQGKSFSEKINKHINKHSADILSSIKIESGDHTLICTIKYKYRHFFIPLKKSIKSEIKMKITDEALNNYKNQESIEDFLFDNLSFLDSKNKSIRIRYPECRID